MVLKKASKILIGARDVLGTVDNLTGGAIGSTLFGFGSSGNTEYSVDKFSATINHFNSIAKTNRFLVTFPSPKFETDMNPRDLVFFCDSGVLPGSSFSLTENRYRGTGPVTFYPTSVIYTELPLTFLGDGQGRVIKYFQTWMEHIMNTDQSPGAYNANKVMYANEVNYKDDYATDITITCYSEGELENGHKIIEYDVFECFPVSINEVPLSWGSQELMRFTVNFRFTYWKNRDINITTKNFEPRLSTGVERLLEVLTIGQTLPSIIRKPQSVGDAINNVNNIKLVSDRLFG